VDLINTAVNRTIRKETMELLLSNYPPIAIKKKYTNDTSLNRCATGFPVVLSEKAIVIRSAETKIITLTHLHQLHKVELGSLQNLHFPDASVLKWVDALRCLLNLLSNTLGDELGNQVLQITS